MSVIVSAKAPRELAAAVLKAFVTCAAVSAAQPSALPDASTPRAGWPLEQLVPLAASAVAVAALPVVLWFNVGKAVMFAALKAGALLSVGACAADPVP